MEPGSQAAEQHLCRQTLTSRLIFTHLKHVYHVHLQPPLCTSYKTNASQNNLWKDGGTNAAVQRNGGSWNLAKTRSRDELKDFY